jgi:Holliday junction resolvasome RuvABC endonuclease subunit
MASKEEIKRKIEKAQEVAKIKKAMQSKYKILALDQASNCGWCTETTYGCWDFNTRKDESAGMKMIRFKSKLREVIQLEGINIVVYERVAGQHANSIIHAAKMVAMIEIYCEEIGINYRAYSAGEIKRFATGNGNANKQKMIDSAKQKYGYVGKNDNEADAIHLYHLAKQDLN